MKLSKQERIGVLIIAVIIILVLGVIFFIVPKVEEVGISQQQLDSKKVEYQAALDKAALKDGLKDQVIEAYETGRDAADMFFEDMTTYEADGAVREFLDYCNSKDVNVTVDSLSIESPTVSTLAVSFINENPEVSYDLKTYATQGLQESEEVLAAKARRQTLMSHLSSSQTVGSVSVSFTAYFLELEDYLKFVDTVNDYQKDENGKAIRKAIKMNGITVEFDDVTEKYDLIMEKIAPEVTKAAEDELKKNFGDKADVGNDNNNNNNGTTSGTTDTDSSDEKSDDDEKITLTDTVYEAGITLTFYSIERMQDPTDILEAQEVA